MPRLQRCGCVLAVWLLGTTPASAQAEVSRAALGTDRIGAGVVADRPSSTPSAIELLERLEQLQRRVEELERQVAAASVAGPASRPLTDAALRALPPATSGPSAGGHPGHALPQDLVQSPTEPETQYPSLKLHGFADVNFSTTDQSGVSSGFNMGQVVLHIASALGPKVSAFVETSFAPRATPTINTVPIGYATEVERAIIRYDYNDAFKVSFGRYHTPINYWNTAFHHGMVLQTTISRPDMIQFGGRFQPVHFIGVLAEGTLPWSGPGIGYNVGVGNGRASIITRGGDAGDSNNHRALLANVFSRPERVYGLQVGASIYRDRITPDRGAEVGELIASAHVAWTKETPELLAEFANVRHTVAGSGVTFNSPAYYVQAAYRLPWQNNRWKPYYRFEDIDTPTGEPVFGVFDVRTSTVGVRYDVADFAAFKGEYRRTRRQPQDPRVNGFFLQTSFTF